MALAEFNYLSENELIRKRLFNVCKLDNELSLDDQRLLAENSKIFENIFM